ncbi:MAG: hypothetical protein Q9165_001847 [Trypethelium subeluteriae]
MASTLPKLPLFEAIAGHDPNSTAIVHSLSGRSFTYGELLKDVAETKENLKNTVHGKDLSGERIAFLIENGYDYVGADSLTMLSIFANHGVAVPMSPEFPPHELQYIVNHSRALAFLSSTRWYTKAEEVVKEGLSHGTLMTKIEKRERGRSGGEAVKLEETGHSQGGMMLFTSGTTSRPKGGRKSADIIKTGGEKVSALEVEREMLSLSQVEEVAVVGLPSEQWGQKVAAVVMLSGEGKKAGKGGKAWGPLDMRRTLRERLATYKIPQEMKVVESIPRNAMGKINKKLLVKEVFPEEASQ